MWFMVELLKCVLPPVHISFTLKRSLVSSVFFFHGEDSVYSMGLTANYMEVNNIAFSIVCICRVENDYSLKSMLECTDM